MFFETSVFAYIYVIAYHYEDDVAYSKAKYEVNYSNKLMMHCLYIYIHTSASKRQ